MSRKSLFWAFFPLSVIDLCTGSPSPGTQSRAGRNLRARGDDIWESAEPASRDRTPEAASVSEFPDAPGRTWPPSCCACTPSARPRTCENDPRFYLNCSHKMAMQVLHALKHVREKQSYILTKMPLDKLGKGVSLGGWIRREHWTELVARGHMASKQQAPPPF